MKDVHQLLNEWGQWKNHAEYYEYKADYGRAQLAKMMQGTIPKSEFIRRKCPRCFGEGKRDGAKCPRCNGAKVVHESYRLVDPRTIPATGPGGMYVVYNTEPPSEFQAIDQVRIPDY